MQTTDRHTLQLDGVRPAAAYPCWIAFVHLFGVRQRIAIELLQLSGFLALIFALRRVLGWPAFST